MHAPESPMNSLYLTASLIGFSAGTAISVLLLIFTVRAAKPLGGSVANILFVACCLFWNVGGFGHSVALTLGALEQGRPALVFLACQYTAAAAWPVTVLSLWSSLNPRGRQKAGWRSLQAAAIISCALIVALLWDFILGRTNPFGLVTLLKVTPYNGAILLALAIALSWGRLVSRAVKLPFLVMLSGAFGATAAVFISQLLPFHPIVDDLLRALSEQITLLVILGAFFLFARFRFSDVFIRQSLRVVLAALIAIVVTLSYHIRFLIAVPEHTGYLETARAYCETLTAFVILILFTFLDRRIGAGINRWMFRAPDYRILLKELSEKLAYLRTETEIADIVQKAAQQSLDLRAAQLISVDELLATNRPTSPEALSYRTAPNWLNALKDGELVEFNLRQLFHAGNTENLVELLLPVRLEGKVNHVLAISPGTLRRGLVTHEVTFLRSLAAQLGSRLDALRFEERLLSVQNHEALLMQQVTQAELRALRAQVNPHFLFNSLNSIANLIVIHPEQAEIMTLRLARVFRHVLANSARPLIPLREEIEFLKTYLQIEEARFGSRLRITIAVDPAIAMERIPSLILQPIVENALQHGLGPKPGTGHLWIIAEAYGTQVSVRVEDDGVGPGNGKAGRNGSNEVSKGVGLDNVAQRLNAMYQEHGIMTFEPRQAGGTRVRILFPRENGLLA